MIYNGYIFEGGAHRHQELIELVEDLGGHVLSSRIVSEEATITFLAPQADAQTVESLAEELNAELRDLPLVATEIAVVTPTLTRHHLPHPVCDIAEHLRRKGAKTNVIGLSRGVGQRIARIMNKEKELIEEQDAAVFILGNFEYCLKNYKHDLYQDIDIPVIVSGGPDLDQVPGASAYVGGIGRIPYRSERMSRIEKMEELARTVGNCLDERKDRIERDPPVVSPLIVKSEIENQVEEVGITHSSTPIVPQLDGVRVKLDYDRHSSDIGKVKIGERELNELGNIKKSVMKDHILVEIYPESEVLTNIFA